MIEEEIKAALSIEIEECGDYFDSWTEIRLLWNEEVISTTETYRKSHAVDS